MKAFVLGIDVNRASSDPSLYPDLSPSERYQLRHLDETAQQIADFTSEVRDHAPFAWGMQLSDTRPGEERRYTSQEAAFHRVIPFPMDDAFLPKTRMSVFPENEEFFEKLRSEGYDTGVLMGFYAAECIYYSLSDLALTAKFRMVVPTELIADRTGTHPMNAFEDDSIIRAAYNGEIIFTNKMNALHFLQTPEDRRRLPYPTVTGEDLNSMHYGMGS